MRLWLLARVVLACAGAATGLLAEDANPRQLNLEPLLSDRALIILAAPDDRKSEYHRTVARLRSEAGKSLIGDGGVIFVSLLERGYSRFGPVRLSMATTVAIRGRFGVASGEYTALLIAPNGSELMRWAGAVTISMFVSALQEAGLAIDELGVDSEDPQAGRRRREFSDGVLALADREFSQTSLEFGAAEAFKRYLGENAVELPAGAAPQTGRKTIYDSMVRAGGDYTLTWEPKRAEASQSGELGYTWGFYTLSSKSRSGQEQLRFGKYVNVWQKDADGLWRVIVDIGNEGPEPGRVSSLSD